MEEKKRTIVMFGDSLTDYFPMEKLKDIDAQFINCGVAGDTIADLHEGFGSNCQIQRFILNLCIRHIPKGLD